MARSKHNVPSPAPSPPTPLVVGSIVDLAPTTLHPDPLAASTLEQRVERLERCLAQCETVQRRIPLHLDRFGIHLDCERLFRPGDED